MVARDHVHADGAPPRWLPAIYRRRALNDFLKREKRITQAWAQRRQALLLELRGQVDWSLQQPAHIGLMTLGFRAWFEDALIALAREMLHLGWRDSANDCLAALGAKHKLHSEAEEVRAFAVAVKLPGPPAADDLNGLVSFIGASPGPPEQALAWYRQYALKLARVQDLGVLDDVKAAVTRGVREGLPTDDVMKLIGERLDVAKSRLETIARTESMKIYNAGRLLQTQGLGDAVAAYEVHSITDFRLCEICRLYAGRVFPAGQLQGNAPPYHFACRCCLAAIFSFEQWEGNLPAGAMPLPGFGRVVMPARF